MAAFFGMRSVDGCLCQIVFFMVCRENAGDGEVMAGGTTIADCVIVLRAGIAKR